MRLFNRQTIIFDRDDMVRLCAGAEISVKMDDNKIVTFVTEESFDKKNNPASPIKISKMDIHK